MGAYCFRQIHIDAARNSTDDFNPFHEPRKCARILGNPYPGPIVLGFQLEQLVEHAIDLHRDAHGENAFIAEHGLHYSNYQLTFANALFPDETFDVDIRPTLARTDPPSLANRVVVRKDAGMVLIGHKRETAHPLFLADRSFDGIGDLRRAEDRAWLRGTPWFVKRKYMNTGNAKNFAAGSLCDQGYYFDELENRVRFPEMFATSLLSCALLEKAMNGDPVRTRLLAGGERRHRTTPGNRCQGLFSRSPCRRGGPGTGSRAEQRLDPETGDAAAG